MHSLRAAVEAKLTLEQCADEAVWRFCDCFVFLAGETSVAIYKRPMRVTVFIHRKKKKKEGSER